VNRTTKETTDSWQTVILCAQAMESTAFCSFRRRVNTPTGWPIRAECSATTDGPCGGSGAQRNIRDLKALPNANPPHRPNEFTWCASANTPATGKHLTLFALRMQGGSAPEFDMGAPGIGAEYKKAVRLGAYGVSLGAFGESLANSTISARSTPNLRTRGAFPAAHQHGAWQERSRYDARRWRGGRRNAGKLPAQKISASHGSRNARACHPRSRNGAHGDDPRNPCSTLMPVARCQQTCSWRMDLALFPRRAESDSDHDGHECPCLRSLIERFDATTSKTGTNMRATLMRDISIAVSSWGPER